MTHFPKRPGGRYRVDACQPGNHADTIVDYSDDLQEAIAAASGVSRRPDVCSACVYDLVTRREVYRKVNEDKCTHACAECPDPRTSRLISMGKHARKLRELEGKLGLF